MANRRKRSEFTKATKTQAWDRCGGKCQKCIAPLITGAIHYDHVIPTSIKPDNSLANCQVLCANCHSGKTRLDRKIIAKAHRLEERRIGIDKPKRPKSKYKRKVDGSVVYRDTGEPVR